MSELRYFEIVAVIEAQTDSNGEVIAWDYGIEQYSHDSDGEPTEARLMAGSADDFETAERNVRAKLANLDRPTI